MAFSFFFGAVLKKAFVCQFPFCFPSWPLRGDAWKFKMASWHPKHRDALFKHSFFVFLSLQQQGQSPKKTFGAYFYLLFSGKCSTVILFSRTTDPQQREEKVEQNYCRMREVRRRRRKLKVGTGEFPNTFAPSLLKVVGGEVSRYVCGSKTFFFLSFFAEEEVGKRRVP